VTGARQVLSYTEKDRPRGGLIVDVDKLISSRMLIQADSGGGKSRALRQLLEETHGRVQQFVIDPEGEFSTLREKYAYVLAAKTGGDVLASPKTAKLLCRRLMELGASAVLDLYELKIGEKREFVKIFLDELMALPKTLWRPLIVVIDEAHEFAPERSAGEACSSEAVIYLNTAGRKRGFCGVLATQRIAKLSKDAAAGLKNKMIGSTTLDVDVDRAMKELGFAKSRRRELMQLEPGEFFVSGPAIAKEVTKILTGPVKTTHPEAGAAAPPIAAPPAKVKAMLAQLVDLPKEAAEEARTVEDLRKENAVLKRSLTIAQKAEGKTIEKVVERTVVDEKAIERAVSNAIAPLNKELARRSREAAKAAESLRAIAIGITFDPPPVIAYKAETTFGTVPAGGIKFLGSSVAKGVQSMATMRAIAEAPKAPKLSLVVEAGDLSAPQLKILATLGAFESMGVMSVEKNNVAVFSNISPTSSAYGIALAAMLKRSLVTYPTPGYVALTDDGRGLAPHITIDSVDELHRCWEKKLPAAQWKILSRLLQSYPDSLTRDTLSAECNVSIKSSAYGINLSTLRSLGLVEYLGDKSIKVTDLLFPEGLAR
jgi:hypothetical protein